MQKQIGGFLWKEPRAGRGIKEYPKDVFRSNEYVHYLDCGNALMSGYLCHNFSNCILYVFILFKLS